MGLRTYMPTNIMAPQGTTRRNGIFTFRLSEHILIITARTITTAHLITRIAMIMMTRCPRVKSLKPNRNRRPITTPTRFSSPH